MDNKAKYYSIVIVPHDARGRPISIKVPASWVYVGIGAAAFALLLVASSLVYSSLLSRRLVHYVDTLSKNREQQTLIHSFSRKTSRVSKAIEELTQKENEIRKILGLKGWKSKIKLSTSATKGALSEFDEALTERKESLEELRGWVEKVRARFAATPSGWPIFGRIVSFMGYRSYPWRGYHSGIDIQAPYGAPVRATAAGTVSFVGWNHGYGKLVEINHGYGVTTRYAHNSAHTVAVGQKVKKGQVVSYVGTTGWTTGPHLHYEVRRWDRPLSPVAYLNLNILTACRLWTVN